MSNEEIVNQIQNGYSVTFNLEILYTNNLPLIRLFLKKYVRLNPQDEEDLLQESFLGLIDAVNHYEPDKGVLFMSYAEHWIKQRARTYISKDKSIRIPGHFKEQISRYKKSVQEYEQLYHRNPSDLDMCEYMDVPLEEIKRIKIWMQDTKSIDEIISDDGSITLGETVQDSFDLEHTVIAKQFKTYKQRTLWDIVDKYTTPSQQLTLKKIYGENKAFKQIAEETRTTTDEVRKLKETGLKKLRSPKAIKEIREKLEMLEESSIMYQSGINSFNNKGMSNTEYLAIKKATLRKFLE